MNPIERAASILGSQAALASALGVSNMAVVQWKKRGVPAVRVLAIERATGGRVTRHDLRPDLYPQEHDATAGDGMPEAESAQATGGTPQEQPLPVVEAAGQGAT